MPARSRLAAASVAAGAILVVSLVVSAVSYGSFEPSLGSAMATRGASLSRMAMRPTTPRCHQRSGRSLRVGSTVEENEERMPDYNIGPLLNDIAEGETIENTDEYDMPTSWEEYEAMVQATGGPEPMEEGALDMVVGTPSISPEYGLNVIWMEKNIALGVDEIFPGNKRIPLTNFHLWPQADAWEELKAILDERKWIDERSTINILNQATEIINFWQESHSTSEALTAFPDVLIRGTEQVEGSAVDMTSVADAAMDGETSAAAGIDTSAIPRVSIKEGPGFSELMEGLSWYRDPTVEGPWDPDSGVWKDVQIKTLEDLHRSVPQKMPGMK
jgi:30S ribosomal protein 3